MTRDFKILCHDDFANAPIILSDMITRKGNSNAVIYGITEDGKIIRLASVNGGIFYLSLMTLHSSAELPGLHPEIEVSLLEDAIINIMSGTDSDWSHRYIPKYIYNSSYLKHIVREHNYQLKQFSGNDLNLKEDSEAIVDNIYKRLSNEKAKHENRIPQHANANLSMTERTNLSFSESFLNDEAIPVINFQATQIINQLAILEDTIKENTKDTEN